MPGKSRRVAARQSQLKGRKKKQQRGPSGIPSIDGTAGVAGPRPSAGVAVPTRAPEVDEPDQDMGVASEGMAVAGTPAPSRRSTPAASRAVPEPQAPIASRGRRDRPAAYQYVGSELRRIAVMSSVVIAAIIALSFFL